MSEQSKIKVLHIIKSLGRGGAEMLLPETLRLHDKEVFEFHYIYFLPWKTAMVESIASLGGLITCIPASNNIELMLKARRVARYVNDNKIQIIHAHLPWAGIVARLVGKMTNIPVLYTEHNKLERYHVLTRTMNLLTMGWLNKVIAVSEDVAKSIMGFRPGLKVPVKTILNGVNIDKFRPAQCESNVREQLGIPTGAPVIGTIAVFRTQKRLDIWIEIAHEILKQAPDVHFVIVGGGPLHDELETKRAALKLVDRIHLVGVKTEVRPYLRIFDIYMMTSIFEGLPIALLEAMASGCPPICTGAGGIKEVINHGSDGFLCPVNQPMQLIEYAILLLSDPQRRVEMGRNARTRIEHRFSMRQMTEALEECYVHELDRVQRPMKNSHPVGTDAEGVNRDS